MTITIKFSHSEIEQASGLVASAEAALGHRLTRGQKTDLLLDNCAWLESVEQSRSLVETLTGRKREAVMPELAKQVKALASELQAQLHKVYEAGIEPPLDLEAAVSNAYAALYAVADELECY